MERGKYKMIGLRLFPIANGLESGFGLAKRQKGLKIELGFVSGKFLALSILHKSAFLLIGWHFTYFTSCFTFLPFFALYGLVARFNQRTTIFG